MTMRVPRLWPAASLVFLLGCEGVSPTEPEDPNLSLGNGGLSAIALGGGRFDVNITGGGIGTFAFAAVAGKHGRATGHLYFTLEFQGQHVEFLGSVTCLSVDRNERRAWVGGVITRNLSEHPSFTTPRTQPGRDIWFRILDNGFGPNAEPDRTTFVGFEGDRDIATSEEYCQVQPWVENNASTWAVVQGNILMR